MTPPADYSAFFCQTCNDNVDRSKQEMMDHLLAVHGFDAMTTPVHIEDSFHWDGSRAYGGTRIITAPQGSGSILIHNFYEHPRSPDDPMYWLDEEEETPDGEPGTQAAQGDG